MRRRYRQAGLGNVSRLRTAAKGVVAGQAAVATIHQGQGAQRHGFARADVFAGHRASATQTQRFGARQRTERENACVHIGRAVVSARASETHRKRIDRACCVTGVSNDVVPSDVIATAIKNHQTAGIHRLVAVADVLVGEGKRCCRADGFSRASAGECADRSCSSSRGCAIVGLGHLRCRHRQVGSSDVGP